MKRLWYRFWQHSALVVFCVFFRIRFFGREHVPLSGPVLLVSNHQSYLDPIVCGVGLRRELDYVARDSLFRNRFFGRFIGSVNAFPIQRDQADIQAVKSIIRRLKNNRAIVVFPEGTRTTDGTIRSIKAGFDLIIRRSGATLVPVVVDGPFEIWPRHQALPSMGNIRVLYGQPFTADQVRQMSREQFVAQVNNRLRAMQNALRLRSHKKPYLYAGNTVLS
jgi:1-acyl-sn-glycerol-3-phosphate acyltransferase